MKKINQKFNLNEFFDEVKKGNSLLILDYDGTLAPFNSDRMKAFPYPGVMERLNSLSKIEESRTVILSGRRLKDLEALLNPSPPLELWGSHGWEHKTRQGKYERGKENPQIFEGLKKGKEICQEKIDPKHYEIKPFSIALHWRGVEMDKKIIQEIEGRWRSICLENDQLEILPFNEGLELRPRGWNKGDAVKLILHENVKNGAVAYIGDDMTDEEAFSALGDQGLKILAREEEGRKTGADLSFDSPDELLVFLDQWILACGGKNG